MVLTASYEARRFGVRSAMPGALARRLCPELLFVRPHFDAYRAASRTIREIFLGWTPLVEPLSLDEAYLDVTAACESRPAVEIARAIKAEIVERTGLTASAGVSFNKLLAKLASDLRKPDGLSVIRPEKALAFLASLPIERFHGVGPATAARMRQLGIASGADLQQRGEADLLRAFGRGGLHYWRIAQAHRRPAGGAGPAPPLAQRRGDFRQRPARPRGSGRRAGADGRYPGRKAARGGLRRPHADPEDQARRFPASITRRATSATR